MTKERLLKYTEGKILEKRAKRLLALGKKDNIDASQLGGQIKAFRIMRGMISKL